MNTEVAIGNIAKIAALTMALGASGFAGWWLSEPPSVVSTARAQPRPADTTAPGRDGATRTPGRDAITIKTERRGANHMVSGEITGPGGAPVPVRLVVDTGASLVVLPASMIEKLGFEAADLTVDRAQTARGRVLMRRARVDAISIGGPRNPVTLRNVEVAFIRDSYLGGMALLGMSFLGRYRVIIDQRRNEMTLVSRD